MNQDKSDLGPAEKAFLVIVFSVIGSLSAAIVGTVLYFAVSYGVLGQTDNIPDIYISRVVLGVIAAWLGLWWFFSWQRRRTK